MAFASSLRAIFQLVRAALATAVLVGAPLAEAAVCGSESLSVETGVEIATGDITAAAFPASEHSPQQPTDARHCVHGHCHHVTACEGGNAEPVPARVCSDEALPRPVSVELQRIAAGLERPPKI